MQEDRRLGKIAEEESRNVYLVIITLVIRSRRIQLTLNCSSVIRWKLAVLSRVSSPVHIMQQKISEWDVFGILYPHLCDMLRPCKKGLKL
jgi:hypothetical protein